MKKLLVSVFVLSFTCLSALAVGEVSRFMDAINKKQVNIAEMYIKDGFNVNQKYVGGASPLIMAIYNNDYKMCEMLLKNNANPNYEVATLTPLHFAIRKKQPEIVNLLIKYNVNVNQSCKKTLPLNFAIQKDNAEIVEMLLKAGAKPDEKTKKMVEKSKNEDIKNLFL